ncbi:hypothetical protein [Thiohalorhabdus denitrificans]|uniref:Uncharacterized protein n=1 Tax=Thiohalorhabdus denitrificans TaxID=381306 RepID=A0A1G5AJL5_9GAMM|nr:hypothetical protein SAMN05661077_0394 [Thiohalorhabdus denitrificans]
MRRSNRGPSCFRLPLPLAALGLLAGNALAGDLDLQEANVAEVAVAETGGAYRFDVTLYHDDDGESGYANWWQVETLEGERLGRRELLHAHGTRPFTRSDTIEGPEEHTHVVVRGHDQEHGYGGQAAVVELETGAVELVDQGPEPQGFGGYADKEARAGADTLGLSQPTPSAEDRSDRVNATVVGHSDGALLVARD